MPEQLKKFRIILKPLGGIGRDDMNDEIAHAQEQLALYQNDTHGVGRTARIQAIQSRIQKLKSRLESKSERVIDADAVFVIDGGSLLAGIEPHVSSVHRQAIKASAGHAKWLRDRRNNPMFYHIGHTAPGIKPTDPSHTDYIVTRKFKKILSINLDSVISVNGKPIMGAMRDLDKGVQHLGLEEDWSVDTISDLLDE